MTVYLALLLAGVILGLLLTPLVSIASTKLGLVDAPGGRKVHLASVPRLGGLAVAAAAALALPGVAMVAPSMTGPLAGTLAPIAPILVGSALVFAIGLIDDVRPLPPWPKLTVQFAAAILVMRSGLLIERITLGGETLQLGFWAWPVTLVWIVGLTNAFNLIDGVDGLAAGISVIAG